MSDSEQEQSHVESDSDGSDEELEKQTEHAGNVDTKKKRKIRKKAPIVTKKRRLEDIQILKEKKITLSDLEDDDDDDDEAEEKEQQPIKHPEEVERKSGVLYIQTVPPRFTPTRVREYMERFGDIGRVYLAAEKRRFGNDTKARKIYTEGWVEFKRKSKAKRTAEMLNNNAVGGHRRTMAAQTLWSVKYLKGFKWVHLVEQLTYENKVDQHRMQAEISQAKRKASHFVEQLEKGENLKRIEQKAKKNGGVFEARPREVKQRQVFKQKKTKAKQTEAEKLELMKMIYS